MQDSSKQGRQMIACDVKSCLYNDMEGGHCTLERITVRPVPGAQNGLAQDESCCGDYRCRG